jgi:hypothetical protein
VTLLIDALVAGGGGAAPMLFMSPGRAARAKILAPGLDVPVVASPTLATTRIIAVDGSSFGFGFSSQPDITVSDQAVLHMDTSPLPISTTPTPAAPVRSL